MEQHHFESSKDGCWHKTTIVAAYSSIRGEVRKDKLTRKFVRRLTAAFATLLAWAASAPAQTVVVGTGNPDLDVPAVQAAVDQGGEVTLKGHFSFNRPPTVPTPTAFTGGFVTVPVSKAVAISGTQDGEMTSIEGGTTPFYVEAAGASVTIQGLRFIRPNVDAIFVYAVTFTVSLSYLCLYHLFFDEGVETL